MSTPIERLRERHQLWDMPEKPNVHVCAECADPWPCDTIAALDALESELDLAREAYGMAMDAEREMDARIDTLQAENARLREQAEGLAAALARALFYSRGSTAKYVLNQLARAEAVLRTYREANHE